MIVIPTYNPTQLLLNTLADLDSNPELKVLLKIIVNDGSAYGGEYLKESKKNPQVAVVDHSGNQGKGAAIKTAMRHVLKSQPGVEYILTVDSDRQHLGKDVVSIVESIKKNGHGMHIGFRQLAKDKTPLRSFIGNFFSRKFFYCFYRVELQDTQSGLRAYPRSCFEYLTLLKSQRYEFEMEAIINTLLRKVKIHEMPIETVYFNKNQSSHFRPLVDSMKVIWVILKMRIVKIKVV